MSQSYSIVQYCGRQKLNSCGYCKSARGHCDHGMWLHLLTVMDYQNLIDRGWRRSGVYGYKPILQNACCKMYTIKCAALDWKVSRSHKKLIKRFNRFLIHGERRKSQYTGDHGESIVNEEMPHDPPQCEKTLKRIEKSNVEEREQVVAAASVTEADDVAVVKTSENISTVSGHRPEDAPKHQSKRKYLRIEKAKQRVMAKGNTEEEAIAILKAKKRVPKSKTVEELFSEGETSNAKHKLEVKLVQSSPANEDFKQTFNDEYEVYRKYQVAVHKDDPDNCTAQQFRRFLVTSPLEPQPIGVTCGPVQTFGSYHQQYWLDGKLIAVGIIDILPYCLSSVYFFYDPDYTGLVLGTYGAIRELQLVRELQKYVPALKYYYMGYYIHSCPKMRYKARISPSYLLCPDTYIWCSISQCLNTISVDGVYRLNPDPQAKDEFSLINTDNVMVLINETILRYPEYRKRFKSNDQNEVNEFAAAVGRKCAYSLILYRS